MNIKILADSSANLYHLEGVDFESVPLKISTDEREFVDDINLDVYEMATYLANYKGASRTSCPNVGEWLEAFGDADIVYCVTIISTLSGSYNAALVAKAQYEEEHPDRKVFVLDSYSAGPEPKLIVEKIRDLVLEGKDFDTVCKEVVDYKENHTSLNFCLESLKNLANNGRVPHAVASLASLIGLRLVGNVSEDGQIQPTDKARGAKKANATIYKCMKKEGYCGGTVVIDHCFNEEAANMLKNTIKEEYPDANVRIERTTGLCSFYAEKGGLMIGIEVN
ncbi:MAG: DegV family protein [Firmicutes bacterium]|nr:DegV family protein [Bacillota bacterium]